MNFLVCSQVSRKSLQHFQQSLTPDFERMDFQLQLVGLTIFWIEWVLIVFISVYQGIFLLQMLFSFNQYQTPLKFLKYLQVLQILLLITQAFRSDCSFGGPFFRVMLINQTFEVLITILCQSFRLVYTYLSQMVRPVE